ncbi:MAG: outer membrane beta-barrel protein [Gemmatimonadota bacterium]
MGKRARWTWVAALVLTAVHVRSAGLEGQAAFGVQGSWGDDTDVGVGGRLFTNLEKLNLDFVASFILFFPDDKGDVDRDAWELNGNLFYQVHLKDVRSVLPYLGGGLNVAHREIGSLDDTELGLNLGGGARFATSSNVTPFVEIRGVVASDFNQVVISGGFLFGRPGR